MGRGYAANPAGYNLWLHDLQRLKEQHCMPYRIGDLESGIFVLIRQIVRGSNLDEDEQVDEAVALA